jgi:glycerophosphoryl diester phosphodiesterase
MGRLHSSLNSIKFISVLWGWPHRFIRKANKHGTKVYASQVDTLEEYQEMRKLPLSGIMTNKIELLAPHFKKN